MKQVAVFKIPSEVEKANAFLAKNPPENVAVLNELVVVNYDDGTFPDSYKREELQALIISNEKGLMTTNISINVGLLDLAEVEKELEEAQTKTADIKSTTIPKGAAYDVKKDRQDKIAAYEAQVKRLVERKTSIEQAIAGFRKTISNFEFKNKVLAQEIAKLKA